jgi:hypothetical protein
VSAVSCTAIVSLQGGPGGYSTGLWTTERIAKLIHRQFGVRYHRDHVGRLLRSMGWSYAYYNLCKRHITIGTTPAVAAGVTDHI